MTKQCNGVCNADQKTVDAILVDRNGHVGRLRTLLQGFGMINNESNGWNRIVMWAMVLLLLAEAISARTMIRNTNEKLKKTQDDQKFMEERLSALSGRVYFPLFDTHAKNCPVCSKDPRESGRVICDEGLELFKKDAEKLK